MCGEADRAGMDDVYAALGWQILYHVPVIATSWVRSAPVVTGQDHLGTIAPAESIFAEQIPGITNVTSRARYYSFYPWLLRELEQRAPAATPDDLVNTIRRAECLFALVAARHARVLGEDEGKHGAMMVGRETLVPALEAAEGEVAIELAEHARRYFANSLGGLGQYYFGALREIGILGGDTRSRDIRYTNERGLPLAHAFGAANAAARFFDVLAQDVVHLEALDELSAFCPCALSDATQERDTLVDLIVDPRDNWVTRREPAVRR
jgi:hypothetical protein